MRFRPHEAVKQQQLKGPQSFTTDAAAVNFLDRKTPPSFLCILSPRVNGDVFFFLSLLPLGQSEHERQH